MLSRGNAEKLKLWIGLRNALVHAYARINVKKVYKALGEMEELEREVRGMSIDPEKRRRCLERLKRP